MDDLSATYALLDALELSESEPGMSESELLKQVEIDFKMANSYKEKLKVIERLRLMLVDEGSAYPVSRLLIEENELRLVGSVLDILRSYKVVSAEYLSATANIMNNLSSSTYSMPLFDLKVPDLILEILPWALSLPSYDSDEHLQLVIGNSLSMLGNFCIDSDDFMSHLCSHPVLISAVTTIAENSLSEDLLSTSTWIIVCIVRDTAILEGEWILPVLLDLLKKMLEINPDGVQSGLNALGRLVRISYVPPQVFVSVLEQKMERLDAVFDIDAKGLSVAASTVMLQNLGLMFSRVPGIAPLFEARGGLSLLIKLLDGNLAVPALRCLREYSDLPNRIETVIDHGVISIAQGMLRTTLNFDAVALVLSHWYRKAPSRYQLSLFSQPRFMSSCLRMLDYSGNTTIQYNLRAIFDSLLTFGSQLGTPSVFDAPGTYDDVLPPNPIFEAFYAIITRLYPNHPSVQVFLPGLFQDGLRG